jgi:5S rRNA maturation endonuclease (ribonuclease M5)
MRRSGSGYMAKCCFHDDKAPSLSISTEKGAWKCHAGCGQGGVLEFEMLFSSCDKDAALSRIAEIVGEQHLNFGQQPEAIYPYTDAFGKLLFQVVRYPGKRFAQRQPDAKGGWIWKTENLKMVLYKLPEVITAKNLIVVEGERDADNLTTALAGKFPHLAVTTSPRGAGKWLDDFALYTAGKQVLVIPDNDKPGRDHAARIALSCLRYAQGVKIVELPELPEHGDVSDFLKTHSVADLLDLAKKTKWWKPEESSAATTLFMTPAEFDATRQETVNWFVEGLVQAGANGSFISHPKSGKSYMVLDLALALASGQKWMDFYIPRRIRVALVSREDSSGLTQVRKTKIMQFRNLTNIDLEGWLYINAKGLKPKIMLDYPDDVTALIADLKRYQSEFLILDVMRVLHAGDENDNNDMQKVVNTMNRIQGDTGVSICLIHHESKNNLPGTRLTERVRGGSAIAGWLEWVVGITQMEDQMPWTRKFECELKIAEPVDPFYWRIIRGADDSTELARVSWEPPKNGWRRHEDAKSDAPF